MEIVLPQVFRFIEAIQIHKLSTRTLEMETWRNFGGGDRCVREFETSSEFILSACCAIHELRQREKTVKKRHSHALKTTCTLPSAVRMALETGGSRQPTLRSATPASARTRTGS